VDAVPGRATVEGDATESLPVSVGVLAIKKSHWFNEFTAFLRPKKRNYLLD
jgi:hypothetical protein